MLASAFACGFCRKFAEFPLEFLVKSGQEIGKSGLGAVCVQQNRTRPETVPKRKCKDAIRKAETEQIIDYLNNSRNITLISPRRLGKTGLIYRIFEEIGERQKDTDTYYISSFFKALGGLRPLISYDALTGAPEISITYRNDNNKALTLKGIFEYLERYNKKVVLAIDEFQQIREYEAVNMEALLRTYIQPLHNVRLIFCGSKKHTMTDIFSNAKMPFYESTTFVPLGKLEVPVYEKFSKHINCGYT